jgi:hypothetical protein
MGKVQNSEDAENQRDAERDEGVIGRENDAVDDHLFHGLIHPMRASATRDG